jgi:hypothetical protein
MANKLRWYPHDVIDALMDQRTSSIPTRFYGYYERLKEWQWVEGSIPADIDEIARLLRESPKDVERPWKAICHLFEPLPDGRLAEPQLRELRDKRLRYSEEQAARGRAGGQAKSERNALAKQTSSERQANALANRVEEKRSDTEPPLSRPKNDFGDLESDVTVFIDLVGAKNGGELASARVTGIRSALYAVMAECGREGLAAGLCAANGAGATSTDYVFKAARSHVERGKVQANGTIQPYEFEEDD